MGRPRDGLDGRRRAGGRARIAARAVVAALTAVSLVGTLVALDAADPRRAAAEEPALEDGRIDCGFGLFCGTLDLGAAPPTVGGQFWYQVVPRNTPAEIAAGEPDSGVAWAALEAEAKAMTSALFGVPNDRRIVEAAREDVVAYMWNRLLALVEAKHDGVPIEPYEQAWLDHLAGELQRKRIHDAQAALAEYDRWAADPCNFDPPDGYGFDPYSPICSVTVFPPPPPPPPPFAQQFSEYGAAIVNSQVFGDADVAAGWNKVAQFAGLLATVGAAGLAGIVAANVVGATASATGIFAKIFPHAAREAIHIFRSTAAGGAGGLFAVIAIAAGVTAVGTWREIETQETLPKLQRRLASEQATTPDLTPILDDDNVRLEAFSVLFAETLPSFDQERLLASTPRPHNPEIDPFFRRGDGTTSPTLETVDWDGRAQTTYLADGWFATRVNGGDYEWSSTLRYETPDGRNATATVNNGQFIIDIEPLEETQLRVTQVSGALAGVTTVGANRRPTVEVSVTDNLTEGSELDFEATTSDADGDEVTVTWYLQPEASNVSTTCIDIVTGDASPFVCPWPVFVGPTVTRQYTKDGDYLGRVVVQDGRGAYTEQRFAFRVRNVAPEVTVNTPVAVTEESTATISGQFSDVGTEATRVTIDWGDGSPTSSQVYPCSFAVAADGSCEHGIFATAAPGSTSWFRTHVYADPRSGGQAAYNVTVTVTDGVDTVVRTVQQPVTPLPLTIEGLTATDAPEGGTMQVTGRIRNPSLDPFVLFVDFGDGTSPINLGYPCAPNSVCPFSPDPPDSIFVCENPCTFVWFSFNVPVTDDPAGQSETRIVTAKVRKAITGFLDTVTDSATISNVAPTLTVDPVSPVVAGAETVVSGNVSDPGTDTGTLNVNWGDGNTSSVNHSLDGTFELHHAYGSPGLRTVSLHAVDDDGGPSATVTRSADVTPAANQAPVTAAPAAPLSASEDDTLSIDLRDFIVSDDLTAVDDLEVAVTDPQHGSLSGTGFLRTYTPAADYHGPDSFDLTVTDDGSPNGCSPVGEYCLATAASTVTVPIVVASVNDVPTLDLTGSGSASEGDTRAFTFTVTDADDGDGIGAGSVDPDCGTAGTLVDDSLDVGAAGGSFTCAFPDGDATSLVSLSLTDLDGAPASDAVAVDVANVAPTVQVTATPSSLLVLPGELVTIAGSFSDPGADLGTVTVTWGDGDTTVLPAQAPGAFGASHAYDDAGTISLTVTVSDGEDNASHTDDVLVAVGAAAIEAIADRLGDAPTGGLTLLQRRALQQAIDHLIGAADKLASAPVAALDKIRGAVERLATVPLEVAATASLRLAQLSRTVAADTLASAKVRTGCVSYGAATCSKGESKALRKADAALAAGDLALAAGHALAAIVWYQEATDQAVRA